MKLIALAIAIFVSLPSLAQDDYELSYGDFIVVPVVQGLPITSDNLACLYQGECGELQVRLGSLPRLPRRPF